MEHKNPWAELHSELTDNDRLEIDAQTLMFRFLSEAQKYQELQGMNRKTLAERIKTSASYLTQLWRGDKPLNFLTLAKMQKALKIRFKVTAEPVQEELHIENAELFLESIKKYHTGTGTWIYRSFSPETTEQLYQEKIGLIVPLTNKVNNDNKALTA